MEIIPETKSRLPSRSSSAGTRIDFKVVVHAFSPSPHLVCMGTCFGTLSKSTSAGSTTRVSGGQRTYRKGRNTSFPERKIWSSSSDEANNIGRNSRSSQRSVSSLSTANQVHETQRARINAGDVPYVNNGLILWEERRREWTANHPHLRASPSSDHPVIRIGSTYEDLLSTSRPFMKPIPLKEMVSFLVGIWEQEGLHG